MRLDCGLRVATDEGTTAGRLQGAPRPPGRAPSSPRRPTELGPVAERLLEVVADDLLVPGRPVARLVLEPAGERLVQLRPRRLRDRVVGRVADHQVAEPKGVLGGEIRSVGADRAPSARAPARCAAHRRPQRRRAQARRLIPRERPCPRPPPARSPSVRPASSWSSRAASKAWIVGGTRRGRKIARSPPNDRWRGRAARRRSASRASPRRRADCLRPPLRSVRRPPRRQFASADEVLDQALALVVGQRLEQAPTSRSLSHRPSPGGRRAARGAPGR